MSHSDQDVKGVLDSWQDKSAAERYARGEAATRPFAEILVQTSKLATAKLEDETYVLDIAAGTGAVEAAIYGALPKEKLGTVKVLGSDISQPMLDYLKARGEKEGWKGLETEIVDGNNIQLPPNTYTHVFVNFGIFMLPSTFLPTMHTLLKPSGFIGITTWAFLPWMPLFDQAISRLPEPRPHCPSKDEIEAKIYQGRAWSKASYVSQQLTEAGFENVQTHEEGREVEIGTPEQFMEPMGLPLGMISTWWPEEDRMKLLGVVKKEMLEVVREIAEGGVVRMKFVAIMGTGWKAS